MSLKPITLTTTTTVDRDSHLDTVLRLNRAGGFVTTLPAATGSGDIYKFYVQTTVTADMTIAALTTDIIQGAIIVGTAATAGTMAATATSDKLTMNGSTTGGLLGSYVEFTDVVSGTWVVRGALVSTGAAATPFSAS
jgi:acetolactate synthase regulatory subunit